MGFYDDTAADVNSLLADAGGPAVLRRRTVTHTPSTGDVTPVVTDFNVTAVYLGSKARYVKAEGDTSAVRRPRARALLRPVDEAPQNGDTLVIDGGEYTLGDVETLRPDGATTVLYKVSLL